MGVVCCVSGVGELSVGSPVRSLTCRNFKRCKEFWPGSHGQNQTCAELARLRPQEGVRRAAERDFGGSDVWVWGSDVRVWRSDVGFWGSFLVFWWSNIVFWGSCVGVWGRNFEDWRVFRADRDFWGCLSDCRVGRGNKLWESCFPRGARKNIVGVLFPVSLSAR